MAVKLRNPKKDQKVEVFKGAVWEGAKTAACLGFGYAIGYGFFPAYMGLVAANQVTTAATPLIGAWLTERVKIQAMTAAYNAALPYAPGVTAVASGAMRGAIEVPGKVKDYFVNKEKVDLTEDAESSLTEDAESSLIVDAEASQHLAAGAA